MALIDANTKDLHVSFKGLDIDSAPGDDLGVDGPVPSIEGEWKPDVESNGGDAEIVNDDNKPEVSSNTQAGEEAPKKKKKKKRKSKGSRKFVSIYLPLLLRRSNRSLAFTDL